MGLSFSVPLKAWQLDLIIYPMLISHLKNYVHTKQHFSYIKILKINNATILKKYKQPFKKNHFLSSISFFPPQL